MSIVDAADALDKPLNGSSTPLRLQSVDPGDTPPTPAAEASSSSMPAAPANFDPDFYLGGVFVEFEVEGCLFRAPTYLFLKESSFFATKFLLPMRDNPEGTPEHIVLPGIRQEDFRNLLKALYPIPIATTLSLSKSEWVSVLKLSTKWYFSDLRKLAISELESAQSITALERILLGRECFISSWLLSGLTDMVNREETINDDEVISMDYPTTVVLFRLREERLKDPYRNRFNSRSTAQGPEATFSAELLRLSAKARVYALKSRPAPRPVYASEVVVDVEPSLSAYGSGEGKKKKKKK